MYNDINDNRLRVWRQYSITIILSIFILICIIYSEINLTFTTQYTYIYCDQIIELSLLNYNHSNYFK